MTERDRRILGATVDAREYVVAAASTLKLGCSLARRRGARVAPVMQIVEALERAAAALDRVQVYLYERPDAHPAENLQ